MKGDEENNSVSDGYRKSVGEKEIENVKKRDGERERKHETEKDRCMTSRFKDLKREINEQIFSDQSVPKSSLYTSTTNTNALTDKPLYKLRQPL